MTHPVYRIETVADMLKVPAERRGAMLRELELMLDLVELTFGDEVPPLNGMDWTDDGEIHTHIDDDDGKPIVSLKVTKEGAP